MKIRIGIEPFFVLSLGYHIQYDGLGLVIYGPKHRERGWAGQLRSQLGIWFAYGRPRGYVGRTWLIPPKIVWHPHKRRARANA